MFEIALDNSIIRTLDDLVKKKTAKKLDFLHFF